ncbi:DNA-binding transcriptional regulator, LysR family [Roseovarius nanhaiticus]|uniref:DNA-binding transcriptional regulator, LysR family n=1 Tax=Roseovarius nanhaiticus TaxID=573024 RepID=A0A1N7FRL7_9RHOB|nr:LysR substrate-binding domain-containing protein [Roseovarius nanhaiticus]SEK47508.1 DNA-binding transcriptional regulator, LysR family [Roseovarius nanhaiticus]SIS02914.1 DNA-binding transcriptional regulator, LysR family [Roseovarius nanhaiticus]
MASRFTNLQTDLLRTFVTVVDLRNFTETGAALGRTQPAISLQIKRLEKMTETKLLSYKGKKIELTQDGQTLLGYAREILRLNDRAAASLKRARLSGTLRIGLPIDYSIEYFQHIIAQFTQANPQMLIDVQCDRSRDLLTSLHTDNLDMVIAITDMMPAPHVSLYWAERPVWACGRDYRIDPDRPIKLIAHPEGCFYRKRMLDSLNIEGREWHIAFESPGISALQHAVLDGLGVTALTKKTLLPGMRTLHPKEGFPKLANIHVGLFYKHIKMSDAALNLIEQITIGVDAFQKTTRASLRV